MNEDSRIQNREWKKPGNELLAKTKAPKFLFLSLKYLTSKLLTNSSKKQIGTGYSQQDGYTGQLRTSGSVLPSLEKLPIASIQE